MSSTKARRRRTCLPYGFIGGEPGRKTIWADFNVGTNSEGLMRLVSRGSLKALRETDAQLGEQVLLTDQDVWVVALLVKQDGIMYAKFDWTLIEDVKGKNPNGTDRT